MIFEFLKHKHECSHKNVSAEQEEAYCPDCGALVKNKWYLVRCSCCNIKRKSHVQYDEIKPDTKFCPNCGGTDFYIEELDKINFVDINYAVCRKIVSSHKNPNINQIWIEKEDNQLTCETKLLEYNKCPNKILR